MTFAGWAQLIALIILIGATAPLLGRYMANVYEGGPSRLDRVFGPIERLFYRACRIDPDREQRWNIYALSLIAFSIVGFLLLYVMQRVQSGLPFNPTDMANVQPALSFNTAVSFVTNTNWQSYAGESTLSHLTQMVGLTVQQFVSAAVGMAVMAALIRGLARAGQAHGRQLLGRPHPDHAADPASDRVRVRDRPDRHRRDHEHPRVHDGAHRRGRHAEDPRRAEREHGVDQAARHQRRRLLQRQLRAPVLEPDGAERLPRALRDPHHPVRARVHLRAHGQGQAAGLRGVRGHARALARRSAWSAIFAEVGGNSKLDSLGVNQTVTATSPGGNAEGKEVRFGPSASGLWCASTTGTSNGSVNSMHDSYTPLGGMTCLVHMKLGEISPGGVGVGLNGLLVMVILAVFIAGLMVGRTPEYLGQEDPGRGGEARRALHPRDAGDRAHRRRHLDVRAIGVERLDLQPRRARLHRADLRVHVGRQQQRLGVRRAHRQHRLHEQRARGHHAVRALLPHHPDAGDRGVARPQAPRARRRSARSPPTRRCSSCW